MAKRSIGVRAKEVLAFARQLLAEGNTLPDVQRALFGMGGKCGLLFPTRPERSAFLKTDEHRQINDLLADLYIVPPQLPPQKGNSLDWVPEDLHIRLPHRTVRALRAQAQAEHVDLDQYIVMKLSELAQIEVASDSGTPPKRKRA